MSLVCTFGTLNTTGKEIKINKQTRAVWICDLCAECAVERWFSTAPSVGWNVELLWTEQNWPHIIFSSHTLEFSNLFIRARPHFQPFLNNEPYALAVRTIASLSRQQLILNLKISRFCACQLLLFIFIQLLKLLLFIDF